MPLFTLGPWGDSTGGLLWSYKPKPAITEIVVESIEEGCIVSIMFKTDNDVRGTSFGGSGGALMTSVTKTNKIEIKCPLYLIGISGTYGVFQSNKVIRSLCFYTNDGTQHGPFGSNSNSGTPFSTTNVKDGYAITGFCGRAGWYLDTIGVYIKPIESTLNPPSTPTPAPPAPQSYSYPDIFVKNWGGTGGNTWKFHPTGEINQIVIFHGDCIDSLQFKSDNGEVSQKFGGNGGSGTTINIDPGVHLTGISGTFSNQVVTSLRFYTNENDEYGLFGTEYGTNFSLSIDGAIVGFHGRDGDLVDAIGVYLKSIT